MTLPPSVVTVLQGICSKPLPNEPNTAAQGSLRLVPGDWLWEACPDATHFDQWEWEEENWRHLSTGWPCQSPAIGYDGKPILNAAGKGVPVTVADAQHFTVTPHIGIATIRGGLSATHVSALMDWSVKWAKQDCPTTESQRALGWMLEGAARVAAANKKAGVKDDRPLFVAKAIVKRLKQTMGPTWLTLNSPSAKQADHGYCRVSRWMSSRIIVGCALWLDQAPWYADVPLTWWASVKAIYLHGLKCQRWAMETSELIGAPMGGCADDYDPEPHTEVAPPSAGLTFGNGPTIFIHQKDGKPLWDGTMSLFAQPALLTAKKHAPALWEEFFAERCYQWFLRSDRIRWTSKMGVHEASVALQFGPVFGWKS